MKTTTILFTIVLTFALTNCESDAKYRLDSVIRPDIYTISIKPYFDTGDDREFTFDGEVAINLKTSNEGVNQIKLHSEDLVFTSSNISVTRSTTNLELNATEPLTFDTHYSFVYINLEAPLQSNVDHLLTINYRGPIRSDLNGFYRSYYTEQGVTKWLGATQMEPTHARKMFPCFDEPEYKATFIVVIDRPASYVTTLSNSKLQSSVEISEGIFRDTFYRTPIMSTYLVAVLVSEFKVVETVNTTRPVAVYSRPDAINQTEYALDISRKLVDALSAYFGVDYYSTDENIKLDHVAVPDFRVGAMENWGLATYKEGRLLYVPEESIPTYKLQVAATIAHEIAHMWFGDLVTCHWWSHIWLHEGFANYFENFIVDKVDPELGSYDVLVTDSLYLALTADAVNSSPALTNENVNSPSEISGFIGVISYQKGGSVIRMIHHLIGDEAFKRGLNSYLLTNAFSTGLPSHMYESLELGVGVYYNFSDIYPGHSVTDVMSSWISQPGYPILNVNIDKENGWMHLEQERFYSDGSTKSNATYHIPITYTSESTANFEDTKPLLIMNNATVTLSIPDIGQDDWVIFNLQQTGFYRVNYDVTTWKAIARGLKDGSSSQVHRLNRAQIVNDIFAFLYTDVVQFELFSEMLEFLSEETEYSVWVPALSGFNSLRNTFMYDKAAVSQIDQYALRLMDNIITELGFVSTSNDSFTTLRNRMQIYEYACKIGHQGCIDEAVTTFHNFKEHGIPVPPSERPVTYCNGLRYGDETDYDFLWNEMITTNVANEASVILSALGCTKVEEKIQSLLEASTNSSSPIRRHDMTVPLTSILADHSNVLLVLQYIRSNYARISLLYPSIESVLSYITAAMHSDEEFQEFASWLESCTECSDEALNTAGTALSNAEGVTSWAQSHYSDIIGSMPGAATLKYPSILGLLFALIIFVMQV